MARLAEASLEGTAPTLPDRQCFWPLAHQEKRDIERLSTERQHPGAATGDEGRFFASLSGLVPLSDTIRKTEFRSDEDSDGTPAVWITIHANADVNPSDRVSPSSVVGGPPLRPALRVPSPWRMFSRKR
jgi:hypothetical protein